MTKPLEIAFHALGSPSDVVPPFQRARLAVADQPLCHRAFLYARPWRWLFFSLTCTGQSGRCAAVCRLPSGVQGAAWPPGSVVAMGKRGPGMSSAAALCSVADE